MNRFTRQDSSWFLFLIYVSVILFSIIPFLTVSAVEKGREKEGAKASVGAVITVPDDYRTIQEGIDAAKSGDKVRIRIGTYKETLQMKDGIILIGEDTEKVVVQCDAKKESVINITNCQTGSISKITFEHTGKDNTPKRRMNVFDIRNSSFIVRDCIIKNGSGHGIGIEEDSRPIIINCAVINNGWTGIYVKGKKANPILKWNLCMNNKNYGISFVESQGGLAEGNKVEKNGWSGICVYGEGATAILKGNKCKGNERSGINIFKKANAELYPIVWTVFSIV